MPQAHAREEAHVCVKHPHALPQPMEVHTRGSGPWELPCRMETTAPGVGTQALGEMSNRASHWGCDEPPGRPAYGHLPLHSSQLPPS